MIRVSVKKAGFSLIELVLSIVIIAIAVMSIPLMLQESAKNDRFSLLQESILAARTKMGNILSFKWDENSPDGNGSRIIRVLDVNAGDPALNRTLNLRRRGHILADKRRRMKDISSPTRTTATVIDAPMDDIDDFNGDSVSVQPTTAANFDYLDQALEMNTTVEYISDATDYNQTTINFDFNVTTRAGLTQINSTNIKMIELRVTTGVNADTPFVFRAFSSNIGQSRLLVRDVP